MAESSTPAKFELLETKTVQEQLTEGEGLLVPPPNYIIKEGVPLPDASVELMDVPIIDLGLLTSSISMEEFDKLRSALTKWGCFQVINHGMSLEFLDKVREVTKQFFALPVEEKKKYLRPVEDIEGYGNDMVFSEQQTLIGQTGSSLQYIHPKIAS